MDNFMLNYLYFKTKILNIITYNIKCLNLFQSACPKPFATKEQQITWLNLKYSGR